MAARKPLTPAQRAAATQRQALYRERQKLTKAGKRIPKAIAPKRPATYRPPSKAGVRAKIVARVDARQAAAQRASNEKIAQINRQVETLRKLPQARNPKRNMKPAFEDERLAPRTAQASQIRKAARNQRIQTIGRGLKRDFKEGNFEGLEDVLETDRERQRYREATRRISAVSAQALAIYFHNEGGSGEFNVALKEIRYPVDGGDAGNGLKRLEDLAKAVEKADALYGDKAIAAMPEERRLELGADDGGRLNL
jgi:hypothetical protein